MPAFKIAKFIRLVGLTFILAFVQADPKAETLVGTAHAQRDPLLREANRAFELMQSRKCEEAIAQARRAEGRFRQQFGDNSERYAWLLNVIGICQNSLGQYAEAEKTHRQALSIREAISPNALETGGSLQNIVDVYFKQGRHHEALPLIVRILVIREDLLNARSDRQQAAELAQIYKISAETFWKEGQAARGELYYKRAIVLAGWAVGENHPAVAQYLLPLSVMYLRQSRYAESEATIKQALAMVDGQTPGDKTSIALRNLTGVLSNALATIYQTIGRYEEAETLYKRALEIEIATRGSDTANVATTAANLAQLYVDQQRFDEAEALFKRSLSVTEQGKPYRLQGILLAAGKMYLSAGRLQEAEEPLRRATEIAEKLFKPDFFDLSLNYTALADFHRLSGRHQQADPLYRRTLAIVTNFHGEIHPDNALILSHWALSRLALGDNAQALDLSRRAVRIALDRLARESDETSGSERTEFRSLLTAHLTILDAVGEAAGPNAVAEAFEVAQWANETAAAAALNQMATRFAADSGSLAQIVRERQDLTAAARELDSSLVREITAETGTSTPEGVRRRLAEVRQRLRQINQRLTAEFPDYALLTKPSPVAAEAVQKLLKADEALVFFVAAEPRSFVFALTPDGVTWRPVALDSKALTDKVATLRSGLDEGVPDNAFEPGSQFKPFDLRAAHDLYGALFGGIDSSIAPKRHLILVANGALTALPFQLLVTAAPAQAQPGSLADYRNAAWMIRRNAITTLPSVASLKAVRSIAGATAALKPMIGFGDPIYSASKEATDAAARNVRRSTQSYAHFWKGVGVDRDALGNALPRLADTADEINAIGAKFGAAPTDIFLRANASETNVKRAPLSDYRVVYFATHGLVAGDVKGVGEPALALTLPGAPTASDDGLLTASEVAQLKLNADWVVLSACNTVAGDKPGAEALSGLVRAFFYAGTRSILVSHWAVNSAAATRLTITMFDRLKSNPGLGRAGALREAMLDYLDDPAYPKNAYPAYWAPFVVVGEGGSR